MASSSPGQPSQQIHTQGPSGGIGTPLIVSTGNISNFSQFICTRASSSPAQPSQFISSPAQPTQFICTRASSSPAQTSQQLYTQGPSGGIGTPSLIVSTGSINASNVCGPDNGNDGVPVSIHVANSIAGGAGDNGVGVDGGPHGVSGQSEQRLKVEDALNYLDQVKYRFGNQPQVYNDFLDIMKEFKSQSIDTPGVISRVSHLFRGHPELIMGFNTFLPPGYKIEVQMNDQLPLGSMSHGGMNYKVTTVHTAPGLLNQHSSTTLVQQHTSPSIPVRSTTTYSSHPGGQVSGTYQGGGNNSAGSTGPITISTGRSISPARPPSLPPSGSGFESVGGSAFTHSLASPFVQNAFPTLQSQPVEFNHAITYVNKIKNRFHSQPDKYKQFLEILHTYQKEQRNSKDGASSKHLTEHEVYNQVAKLFENQEDLLAEFGQFLPDATPPPPPPVSLVTTSTTAKQNHTVVKDVKRPAEEAKKPSKMRQEYQPSASALQPTPKPAASAPKRSIMNPSLPSAKKLKYTSSFKDVSLAEAGKYGTLNDFAFFDKVRHLLRSPEVYDNFLRILLLFNDEVISRSEVLHLASPFLSKAPELLAWFKDFLGHNDQASAQQYEPVQSVTKQDKLTEEQVLEIDFSTCKRLGASYCALPKNHMPPKCSGRTPLCKEVLNDVWVSFPTWSEDSTFVTSRKTQFEEYIYRCEDERFELDVVIETNTETIRCLEAVAKKMSRMSQEELQEFQLDDCLGGTSPTIHQRAIRRLYGEKAADIIEGLKKLPTITVPMVLKRLKAKEDEWREAQKGFNKIWREQIERFYLKSLDHQGINFKQADIRALRSKALITEIETVYDERQEQNAVESATGSSGTEGPHLRLPYRDRSVLDDACNLLLHHVRRQSGIQKEDKRKIKQILKQFIPDLFQHERMEMSDDENEEGCVEDDRRSSPVESFLNGNKKSKRTNGPPPRLIGGLKIKKELLDSDEEAQERSSGDSRRTIAKRNLKEAQLARQKKEQGKGYYGPFFLTMDDLTILSLDHHELPGNVVHHPNPDESYRLFFANNTWYVFLRLHQILCERLTKLLETANALALNEPKETRDTENSAAIMLRLKLKPEIEIEEYYPTFLEMVKNLLDGNMETNLYEDQLREMFGIHAYIAYTMDKVVANAVRQLQNLVTDDGCQKCQGLYSFALGMKGVGGPVSSARERLRFEVMYQHKAERLFGEENCVKVVIFQKNCEMTMELMDGEPQSTVNDNYADFPSYVGNYGPRDGQESVPKGPFVRNPLFMNRNRRRRTGEEPTPKKQFVPTVDEMIPPPEALPNLKIKQELADEEIEIQCQEVEVVQENVNIENVQHTSCSFNPSNYKMVYVSNGEDYLYRSKALGRAKETHKCVTLGMLKKFEKWHEDWLLKNTTRKDRSDCEAWLKESPKHDADVRAKRVLKVIVTDEPDKTPYRQFKRYVINTASGDRH